MRLSTQVAAAAANRRQLHDFAKEISYMRGLKSFARRLKSVLQDQVSREDGSDEIAAGLIDSEGRGESYAPDGLY